MRPATLPVFGSALRRGFLTGLARAVTAGCRTGRSRTILGDAAEDGTTNAPQSVVKATRQRSVRTRDCITGLVGAHPTPHTDEVDLRVGGEGKYKESLFLQSFLPRNSYRIHRVLVSYLCITGRRHRVRLHGQGWTVRVYFPLAPLWNLVWNLGLVSSPVPFPDGPLFAGFVCIPS